MAMRRSSFSRGGGFFRGPFGFIAESVVAATRAEPCVIHERAAASDSEGAHEDSSSVYRLGGGRPGRFVDGVQLLAAPVPDTGIFLGPRKARRRRAGAGARADH